MDSQNGDRYSNIKNGGYEMGVKPRSGGPEKVKPKGDGPDIKKIGNATEVTSTPHLNGGAQANTRTKR